MHVFTFPCMHVRRSLARGLAATTGFLSSVRYGNFFYQKRHLTFQKHNPESLSSLTFKIPAGAYPFFLDHRFSDLSSNNFINLYVVFYKKMSIIIIVRDKEKEIKKSKISFKKTIDSRFKKCYHRIVRKGRTVKKKNLTKINKRY